MIHGIINKHFYCVLALALLGAGGCGRLGFVSHERPLSDGGADDLTDTDGGTDLGAPMDADVDMPPVMMDGGQDAELDAGIDMENDDAGMELDANVDMPMALMPSVKIEPTTGLITTEEGDSDTFSVQLGSPPDDDVTIELSSSDVLEVSVSPASITFTPDNWASAQIITVTGVADGVPDGNKPFIIATAPCVSTDVDYGGLDAIDVTGTNYDDAMPGILVAPTSGLETTEAGGTATFTIALQAQPETDVAIDLSVSDATEGSVSPAMAVFTSFNWNIPQEITVTGADDFSNDGDVAYEVIVGPASGDPDYVGLTGTNVSVTNLDDDSPGFSVAAMTGLTGEDGTADTITVTLSSQPIASVTVTIASSDTTEGTVSPMVLSFTPATWNTPRTVTVTGVNDMLADGNVDYDVVFAIMATADPDYAGLAPQNVAYTNIDNDTPAITVSPSSGLVTSESGGTATFSIALNTAPTSDVTIGLSSDTPTEGSVSPSSVTFTPLSFGSRTVTVTGVNDFVADGARVYHIVTAPATSMDATYNTMNATDVTVTNNDNDTAAVIVTPSAGLTTTESGGVASFTVRLGSQPSANVSISLMSSNTAEGTITLSSLTFTSGNWSVPQSVVITGVNDTRVDGNIAYTIITGSAVSTDMSYSGMTVSDVAVTNNDNDTASVIVSPSFGLVTTELGGTATFTMVLASTPSADVSIALSSSDLSEGTVAPASVTFTSANWNVPQTVTVSGVDDALPDGDISYTIVTAAASSADPIYNALGVPNVTVTNTDNDIVGITVTPTSGLVTTEAGGTATFTVVLDFAPTANVTITLTSGANWEGRVSPSAFTFTTANWNVPQTATIVGQRDGSIDADAFYTIVTSNAVSADPVYNGRIVSDVTVTNLNVDSVGVNITPLSGLMVSENRTTAQFLVSANSIPNGICSFSIASSDTTEGIINATTVYLNSDSWNNPIVVTVTGVEDSLIDGDQGFTIVTGAVSSTDPAYNGMAVPDVSVTNIDNDTGDIVVTPTSSQVVTEMGSTATFSVFLSRAPSANVVVGLSSADTGEGTVSPSSLTFTTANWATPRTVTVTGVSDGTVDGNQALAIVTAPATSTDGTFSGLDAADVTVTVLDVDSQRCVACNATTYAPGWGAIAYVSNALSYDGRYIVFDAPQSLMPTDTNSQNDVYLRDRQTGTLSVVSVGTGGTLGNSYAQGGVISRDARYVAFTSMASNLIAGDTNGVRDVFLRDRTMDTTARVSFTSTGAQLSMESFAMGVSDDGRYVLFATRDSSVVPGDTNDRDDYFLRDMLMSTTIRVSLGNGGYQLTSTGPGSGGLSGDGRYLVFSAYQSLTSNDTNFCQDVYRRDLMTNIVELVSVSPTGGTSCRYGSLGADISGDGRYISFWSDVSDFVPNDTNAAPDTFVRDMVTGTITRASLTSTGAEQNSVGSRFAGSTVSDDGRRVGFVSSSTNLVPGDTNNLLDVFVRDIMAGTTTLVSESYDGAGQNAVFGGELHPQISGDGSGVVFTTIATNILAEVFETDTYNSAFYMSLP